MSCEMDTASSAQISISSPVSDEGAEGAGCSFSGECEGAGSSYHDFEAVGGKYEPYSCAGLVRISLGD